VGESVFGGGICRRRAIGPTQNPEVFLTPTFKPLPALQYYCPMSNRVLILFAHPALEKSRVNRHLMHAVDGLEGVTFHDLYEEYPDFQIDVAREQDLLRTHDVIVLQHPFYWYSGPALLKEWMDLVLEHGFAYGAEGKALRGKTMLNAITTGGPRTAYQADGYNRFTIRQLLAPFDQTAHLCGMRYLAPFVVHRSLVIRDQADAAPHAAQWRLAVEALVDQSIDFAAASLAERLNDLLPAVAGTDGVDAVGAKTEPETESKTEAAP
jgi:glutathione-regulated potassium-efflux system ancillary protein KefG